MEKRYKVKLNSTDKIEELLQEIYNEACRQLNQVQTEMDKLMNNINLADESVSIEDKAKYAKAIHDYLGDKDKAIKSKFEIAKFMGEVVKHNGDINGALNDPGFSKATKLDIKGLKSASFSVDDDSSDSDTYILKN